jgi:hypothetical protein
MSEENAFDADKNDKYILDEYALFSFENNKSAPTHYTPKLNEFFVGFEFEQTDGYSWVRKVFPELYEDGQGVGWDNLLSNAIKQKFVRVKYLDEQDVLDLFEAHNESINEGEIVVYNKLKSYFVYCKIMVFYFQRVLSIKVSPVLNGGNKTSVINSMQINNKSELKRVLCNCGILLK